jgi:three-Cys-motif partner protein
MPEIPVVGPWAKEKLDALGRYLDFYTKVLKNQKWRTIYVDAFAGGGRAIIRPEAKRPDVGPTLFDDADAFDVEQRELIDGSPRVALELANPFTRYVFIEPDKRRGEELEALRREYEAKRKIDVLRTTAAEGIEWIVSRKISRSTHRGIAFLDPFGASLEWASIQKLANTGLFEVVVNFALNMAILRLLPNSGQVPAAWMQRLDAYFGTREWFSEVYGARRAGLFDGNGVEKYPDYSERLLNLYRRRLKNAFGHVSAPRLIRNTRGTPLYYLLWAGPHGKGLQGADYILKMGELVRVNRRPVKQSLVGSFGFLWCKVGAS